MHKPTHRVQNQVPYDVSMDVSMIEILLCCLEFETSN